MAEIALYEGASLRHGGWEGAGANYGPLSWSKTIIQFAFGAPLKMEINEPRQWVLMLTSALTKEYRSESCITLTPQPIVVLYENSIRQKLG